MLQSAQNAVQTTREVANESLDKAEAGVRELRREASPVIDDLASRAQDLATRSIDFCADTGARARRQVQQAADATTRYVVQQPGKSMAIAAAAGAALTAAVVLMSRRRKP
jgi:ElaB/YqjD/DUF883 family membrane-anchored ribosome-binding protein